MILSENCLTHFRNLLWQTFIFLIFADRRTSSDVYVSLGTTALPISAYQFIVNLPFSASAWVQLVTLESRIG